VTLKEKAFHRYVFHGVTHRQVLLFTILFSTALLGIEQKKKLGQVTIFPSVNSNEVSVAAKFLLTVWK
jgi:hypothetical protein